MVDWSVKQMGEWIWSSVYEPCPICGQEGCGISVDRALVRCKNVMSDRPTRTGQGWIHVIKYIRRRDSPLPKPKPLYRCKRYSSGRIARRKLEELEKQKETEEKENGVLSGDPDSLECPQVPEDTDSGGETSEDSGCS